MAAMGRYHTFGGVDIRKDIHLECMFAPYIYIFVLMIILVRIKNVPTRVQDIFIEQSPSTRTS